MKCTCGNDAFSAHQVCYHDITVDSSGCFTEDHGVYESEHPYGPFTCTACGKEYETLEELTD